MQHRWFMVWLAVFGLAAGLARGQPDDTTVTAEVSRSSVYVGDEVVYQVVVRGGRAAGRPSVAFPSSVRARDAGVSESSRQFMQVVNGQMTRVSESSVTYQYRLTALEPGEVTIPAAIVTMPDGRQIQTEPVSLNALLPRLASGFDLRVEMDRTRVFLGETVSARVVWTLPEPVANPDFNTSLFDPSLRVEPAPPGGNAAGELIELSFMGERVFATAERVFEAGGSMIRLTFRLLITPTEAGTPDIGPMRVVFDRESPRQGAGRGGIERAYSESDPVMLDVRPLPTEGRPDGFTGLIGRYTLRTLATPTTVNVGDPITLRAELRGREPMVGADTLPDLSGMAGFGRFRLSSEGWREETPREPGRRVFSTTIRALSEDVTQIPPVTVHAFDPESAAYEPVASEPIEIEVRAVREATLADARMSPGSGRPGNGPAGPDRPVIGPGDAAFWAAPDPEEALAGPGFRAWEVITEPVVVIALASGPLAIVGAGAFVVATRRRGRPQAVRERALRRAEHLVLRAGPAAGVRAACAAVLDCDPDAVTRADVERLPVHPGIVRTLGETLERDESPGRAGEGPAPGDTRLAIRTLRRSVRTAEVTR